jgi:hypothetical protein
MPENRPVNLNSVEHERGNYCHFVPLGTDWRETLKAEYFEHICFRLRDGDRIEIHSHDHRVQFEIIVLSVNHRISPPHLEAAYRPIFPLDLPLPTHTTGDHLRFRVRAQRGAARRFEIFDGIEGAVIRDGLDYQIALDTAGALELGAQNAEKMTDAEAAVAALAKAERGRLQRREI